MRLSLIVFVALFTGCVSADLEADHVQKERATYNALQPFVLAGIATIGSEDKTKGKAGALLNKTWDQRITSYEERLAKRDKQ
jgi:hypothetical protein